MDAVGFVEITTVGVFCNFEYLIHQNVSVINDATHRKHRSRCELQQLQAKRTRIIYDPQKVVYQKYTCYLFSTRCPRPISV